MNDVVIHLNQVQKELPRARETIKLRQEAGLLLKRLIGQAREDDPKEATIPIINGISFDIYAGEKVGIIGKNGAGKTTLLQLIAQIGKPTSGELIVNRHVVAILGLTAGFEPYRTGLENIYLVAAFYQVSRKRLEAVLDDIIDFSELGDAIHNTINTYSSGMVARLGVSIIFHLISGIIILDEVLAVGDLAFMQKCIHFISDLLSKQETTFILVSHSMDYIAQLCERVIWIDEGKVAMDGEADEVILAYQRHVALQRLAEANEMNSSSG